MDEYETGTDWGAWLEYGLFFIAGLVVLGVIGTAEDWLKASFGNGKEGSRPSSGPQGPVSRESANHESFESFALTAQLQTVSQLGGASSKLEGWNLGANDAMLHSWYDLSGMDWEAVHRFASQRFAGVPPYASRPYWTGASRGASVPISVLAFCGSMVRARIARDPDTEDFPLEMLSSDSHPDVRAALLLRN